MAISKKFIGNGQVGARKVLLENNTTLQARNAADSADVDLLKLDASNLLQFSAVPYLPSDASADGQAVRKSQMDSAIASAVASYIPSSEKGAVNGVATLDGSGKIPVAQLPNSVMEFKGAWDASLNSPALADGTGNAGDVYRVSVAGTQNLGSGSILFYVGDFVIYSGSVWQRSPLADGVISVNGQTGAVTLNTDNISEGSANQYFTAARAKSAAVSDAIVDGVTDVAPSQNAVYDALALKQNALGYTAENQANKSTDTALGSSDTLYPSQKAVKTYVDNAVSGIVGLIGVKGSKTLSGTDISNQYIDLPSIVYAATLQLSASRVLFYEDTDYTLSTVGGVTRVTFTGPLASSGAEALVSGDILVYKYLRQ